MAQYIKTEEGYKKLATVTNNKMDKIDPVGTGSFSMNRKAGTVIGTNSHAEGDDTTASRHSSHAEGYNTTASGSYSHAEGYSTTARENYSHAEGSNTTASSEGSHAEGYHTTASGQYSHAEGNNTIASGKGSHAEGTSTKAHGGYSHAEGYNTTANGNYSHVQGKCNIADTSNKYADIIGNGTSNTARSNAATVDWSGNAWFAGDIYTGSTSGTNKDDGSKKLATEEYVNSSIAAGGTDISLGLTSASVGQIIKVKAIDASGKPTAWEAADMPTGEKDFELIFSDTITEDANGFVRTVDKDGNPFELKEAVVIVYTVPFESSTSDVGRGVGFLPSTSWGHDTPASISGSIPAGTSSIARYDVLHVKVVQGYQCLIDRWGSQNSTNVRGVMTKTNIAGQVPINFKFGDNVTAIGELSNSQGNMTCLKIVSYGTCMAKGDVVILYGKRV